MEVPVVAILSDYESGIKRKRELGVENPKDIGDLINQYDHLKEKKVDELSAEIESKEALLSEIEHMFINNC